MSLNEGRQEYRNLERSFSCRKQDIIHDFGKSDSTIQANTLDFEELSLPPADLPGRVLLSQSHSLN